MDEVRCITPGETKELLLRIPLSYLDLDRFEINFFHADGTFLFSHDSTESENVYHVLNDPDFTLRCFLTSEDTVLFNDFEKAKIQCNWDFDINHKIGRTARIAIGKNEMREVSV